MDIVDTAGAAKILKVGQATLERWRCDGGGPRFMKFGRTVRYRICDLEDWAEQRLVSSTSEAVAA